MGPTDSHEEKRVQDPAQHARQDRGLPVSAKNICDGDGETGKDQDKLNCSKSGQA